MKTNNEFMEICAAIVYLIHLIVDKQKEELAIKIIIIESKEMRLILL